MVLFGNIYGGDRPKEYLEKNLFFNNLNTIFIEGAFELMLAAYFTLYYLENFDDLPLGECISFFLACFIIFIYGIIFPVQFILLVTRQQWDIDYEPWVEKYIGSLYENIRVKFTG